MKIHFYRFKYQNTDGRTLYQSACKIVSSSKKTTVKETTQVNCKRCMKARRVR